MSKNKSSVELSDAEWRATAAWEREHVKRQVIGPLVLHSFYRSIDDWNVFLSVGEPERPAEGDGVVRA